jgi:hypothetical protein
MSADYPIGDPTGGAAYGEFNDPVTAVMGGVSLLGGVMQADAASSAANTQAAAADAAAQAQLQGTRESIAAQEKAFERQVALQKPFRDAGITSQNKLMDLLGLSKNTRAQDYGTLARAFTGQDMYKDPGYGFRLNEGVKALDRSAAARGGLLGGNQLRGVTQFGQDYGSQEYMNAFNRYQTERQARLNPLQSLLGAGQTSSNTLTGAAGDLGSGSAAALMAGGNAMAGGLIGAGNARASGYIGSTNAITNALGQGANYYGQQQMLNRFFPTASAGGSGNFYPRTPASGTYPPGSV